MDQVDDRTVRVDFSADGLVKLKHRVDTKLQEFMGDYADDSLVEYVIVLISNGRHKEEAKSDLDVFLGDDCDSFVSWLWDHLTSNINEYAESQKSIPDEALRPTSPKLDDTNNPCHLDPGKEQAGYDEVYKKWHKRKWRALMSNESQQPTLDSCLVGKVDGEVIASQSGRHSNRSASPNSLEQRKRRHDNEHERPKLIITAPRRLLQFAVRDALATARPSTSVKKPVAKRLRSLVSTPNGVRAKKVRTLGIHSTTRVPDTIAVAANAVAETVEDAGKATCTSSVFGQLNHGARAAEVAISRDNFSPDIYCYYDELMDYYHRWEMSRQMKAEQGECSGKYVGNSTVLQSYNGEAFRTASDTKVIDGVNVTNDRLRGATQTGSYNRRNRNSSHKVQCSMAQKSGQVSHGAQLKGHDPPVSAASASRKILNISVNENTWKPPHDQSTIDATELNARRSGLGFLNENKDSLTPIGNRKAATQMLNEKLKNTTCGPGLHSTGRPLEIADDRTIFVNNVHFAATKDTLSRHFNKFGEVLKVTILTDAATGQPKGSAYVEFMLKEAVENALSLDGTSFMSRILKVVKKSAAHQEPSASMTRPRVSVNTPIVTARFSRAPILGASRARHPAIREIRSMRWIRDTQPCTLQHVSPVIGNKSNAPTVVGRGLTYVRGETKSDANPGSR